MDINQDLYKNIIIKNYNNNNLLNEINKLNNIINDLKKKFDEDKNNINLLKEDFKIIISKKIIDLNNIYK